MFWFFMNFFIAKSTAYASETSHKEITKQNLDYLKERGIITDAQASFIQNNAFTKSDTILYLFKILETIDKEKATKENLAVIESLLVDIFKHVERFKLEVDSLPSIIRSQDEKIQNVNEVSSINRENIGSIKENIIELDRRIDKYTNDKKNRFLNLFRHNSIKIRTDLLFGINTFRYFFDLSIKEPNEYFAIDFGLNKIADKLSFSSKIIGFDIKLFRGINRSILSRSGVFLLQEINSKRAMGIKIGYEDSINFSFSIDKDKNYNFHVSSTNKVANFSTFFRLNNNVNNFIFLELTHTFPFQLFDVEFGAYYIDLDTGKNRDVNISALSIVKYSTDILDLNVRYFHSFGRDKNYGIIYPSISYTFDKNITLSFSGKWDVLSKSKAFNYYEANMKYIFGPADIRLFVGFREILLEDSNFEEATLEKTNSVFSSLAFKYEDKYIILDANIYGENRPSGLEGYFLIDVRVPLSNTGILFLARYTYSSASFENNIFDSAGKFVPISNILGSIKKSKGAFELGVSIDI